MILIIDNYDSFVYNLARYTALAGWDYDVVRNDQVSVDDIEDINPEALILSPGPCTPQEAGICVDAVRRLGGHIPILGVCLGHQCIGEAYGARTSRSNMPTHGKATAIKHDGTGLFHGLPSPLNVGRYHSLVVDHLSDTPLVISAQADTGEVMAFHHKDYPVCGVQFHPESILTDHGLEIIKNFKRIALS